MIRLIVADDQETVRTALRVQLELEPDLEVVGEADDGTTALALAETLHPHVVLMDIRMRAMDGLSATRTLRELSPHIRVVILTLYDDPSTKARAKEAGAVGFVGKHEPCEALVEALRRAAA
jgi:DNA-binding NarL/FixJ family response regulator